MTCLAGRGRDGVLCSLRAGQQQQGLAGGRGMPACEGGAARRFRASSAPEPTHGSAVSLKIQARQAAAGTLRPPDEPRVAKEGAHNHCSSLGASETALRPQEPFAHQISTHRMSCESPKEDPTNTTPESR